MRVLPQQISPVTAWTKAGLPSQKIVFGVASYGLSFSVPATSALQGLWHPGGVPSIR